MTALSSVAVSGMQTALARLNASAHNIANGSTEGFHRQEVVATEQPGGGVAPSLTRSGVPGSALETDVVAQLQAKNAFLANLAVFKTSNQMAGALLDTSA